MGLETAFTMDTSSIKYGQGVTREVGLDMKHLGATRVLVVTDPGIAEGHAVQTTVASLRAAGLEAVVYAGVKVEPTDVSLEDAARFAAAGGFDGYVGVGGGSSMDTCKAANLYATWPAPLLDYVNPPIGRGRPIPGPLKPMICIPTTAGTGSETTGVVIFDLQEMNAKTGIAHRALRPVMGIIDPDNTRSLPPMVAACTALDQFCHAIEAITALPFSARPAPSGPGARPAYQGANPISHIWASKSIELMSRYLVRNMADPDDDEARGNILLAATYAGIGFGNAGVHLCHGMSYPVSSMVRDYYPPGYPADKPRVPHGMSVILHAPAVFRFTAPTNPALHLHCASLMGVDVRGASEEDAGEILAGAIIDMMKRTSMPSGLAAVGFTEADLDALVAGTLPQHRVTKLSPRPAGAAELRQLFRDSMVLWE